MEMVITVIIMVIIMFFLFQALVDLRFNIFQEGILVQTRLMDPVNSSMKESEKH